jgi:hypothetical protein
LQSTLNSLLKDLESTFVYARNQLIRFCILQTNEKCNICPKSQRYGFPNS